MRVIPVLDLRAGRAVRASGGNRAHYQPARSVLHAGSDPIGLARSYRDVLSRSELYLADLDAIAGAPPALDVYGDLIGLGLAVWVDAGVRDRSMLPPLLGSGAATLVLGLETLRGPEALAEIVAESNPDRLVFSLDLRDGRPIVAPGARWPSDVPRALAEAVLALGLHRIVLLDLSRVGTGRGLGTLPLLADLRQVAPDAEISVGGGVAGPADLPRLADAGASAVLIGSALHDGRIGPPDLAGFDSSP